MSSPAAVLALAALLAEAPAPGGTALPPRPHVSASRTAIAPLVDGRLDDAVWLTALPSSSFTQHFPDEGAPPSERTSVRVLYDDENLYVGIDCEQLRSPVVRRLMRRDGQLPSDGVWIDIDSRRSGVGAFHFSINAAGVLSDGIHFNDTDFSSDWDAVWEAKVADSGHGYSVEFRIPLAVLRFSAAPTQDWGFQVRRFIDARQETDDWAFYPRSAATYIHLFGRIDNLVGLAPRHSVELRPFVLGRAGYRGAGVGTTLTHGATAGASAGLDAKAHVTNELTLDLTVNPDFGQVEADTVILNLSTFETFFPEKRPFFLEGIDTFATTRPLVYTRRIGHAPAPPTLGAGEQLIDNPNPSPIWGAAKLVGTVGGRTTVGLLSAVTGANEAGVVESSGVPVRRIVEPWTTFNVLRLKRQFGNNGDVGLLATATNRFETALPATGICPATQGTPASDGRCTNDAYVVSTDGRWRSPSGNYGASWQAMATALQHGPDRPQRDGIPIQPDHIDGGGSLYLVKDGGEHWLGSASQYLSGRELEFNDMGYLERKNDYQGYFTLTYRTLTPWWRTVETRTSLQLNVREALDGVNLWNELLLGSWWNLSSYWSAYVEVHARGNYYDDREVGDGTALERSRNIGLYASVASDPRRRVTGSVSAVADRREGGGHLEASAAITLRALPRLELSLLPTVGYDTGAPRYVSTDPTANVYLFAKQNAANVGATVRAAYTFTPDLSLQLYTQLFLARVRYGAFLACQTACPVGDRDRVPLANLGPPQMPPTTPSPDSELATLNVNVVLRWEYHLGSTLFLVYTRAQNPALVPTAGGASFELRPIWRGLASTDLVMIKLAYWWG